MGGAPVGGHFNGKIEAPALLDRPARRGGAALVVRRRAGRRDRRVGLLARRHEPAHRRRRAQRAARRAGQPARARHEGRALDGRGDVLAPRPRALRGHPLPRRRPVRLRLADRLHVHGARRPAERRLRGAPGVRGRRGDDPVLRAPAAGRGARPGLPPHPDLHVHRLREHRAPASPTTRTARASRRGARGRGRRTSTATTGCRRTTSTPTAAASPTPRACARS